LSITADISANAQFLIRFGAQIKKLRKSQNISQAELAKLCHFEKASVSRIESGQSNLTIKTLYKISTALNIEIGAFFIAYERE
jgi:transcriptional regulator with XRE-family HTH domain